MLSSLCRFESQASSFYLCLEPSWFLFWEKFTLSQLLWCSANLILPLLCWQYNCCLCFSCTGLKLCGFHITNTWVGNKEMNELMCMHMWRAWCSALCWLKGTLRWVGQSLPVFHFCHSVLFMTALVYGGHVYVCAYAQRRRSRSGNKSNTVNLSSHLPDDDNIWANSTQEIAEPSLDPWAWLPLSILPFSKKEGQL
jgi:hypothetical protein